MNEPQSSFRSPPSTFAQILHADGPDLDLKAKLALYAWIVGRWDMEVTALTEDGKTHMGRGEIHAGWVLRGRAIQDVWMIPRLEERTKVWRGAAARDRQLVWHNAAHLRSKSRRLAHSVERSRNIFFHAADCASSGWRHRAGRARSERRRHALDIFRDPIRLLSLDGRTRPR